MSLKGVTLDTKITRNKKGIIVANKKGIRSKTLISDKERRVIFLGRTFVGSTHDYKMFKKEFSPSKPWFKNVEAYVDLGYQGIKKDYSSAQHCTFAHFFKVIELKKVLKILE